MRRVIIDTDPDPEIARDGIVDTPEGHRFEPWTDGHAVGFRVTAPGRPTRFAYLAPSVESDDGAAVVFLYAGDAGDPAIDSPECHLVMFEAPDDDDLPALWSDLNGHIVCSKHAGSYLRVSIAANPGARRHETPITVWDRMTRADCKEIAAAVGFPVRCENPGCPVRGPR